MMNDIVIRGAREHNLKNIDITIPRDKLVVLTGLSGSGKSSLAFDTIYAEGQRRYVESLSSYARMFLGQMEKPDVDSIDGLSPAISIDQKSTSHNPRSTVGTVTEIHDYLRLLYARCGLPHCTKCGREIQKQTIDQVVDQVLALEPGTRIQIVAPCVRGRKGEFKGLFDELRQEGYARVRVDGTVYDLSVVPALDKKFKHSIDAVIDRLVIKEGITGRLTDSLETAFRLGKNLAIVDVVGERELLFSQNYACPDCGISMEELTPRLFSFNNPFGACAHCSGLGVQMKVDPALVIPNTALSLRQGAVEVTGWNSAAKGSIAAMYFEALMQHYGTSMDTPFKELPEEVQNAIFYGTGETRLHVSYTKEFGSGTFDTPFEGIIPNLE
ncbi:MAG: excinuclease ABC subunit UvrA, partial [Clostridia bacterium]|nr:excinuclease ABC subunit UvrA [Clostridia bacterium]